MSIDPSPAGAARDDLARRVDAIEAGYELMLAFAAQGLPDDTASPSGAQLREHLRRFDAALDSLADAFRAVIAADGRPADVFGPFLDVLSRDAAATQAGLRLVLAQPRISSQLVDNLNANIHVRALLTDVFVADESLKGAAPGGAA